MKKNKIAGKLENKANRAKIYAGIILFYFLSVPLNVYAADAAASWNQVMNFIIEWVPRLGGVLLFLGGIEFALAYKNEDANAKTNATRLMISGAMVIAIPVALSSLLQI